ncbi:protein of unassigned function [Methylobacterium oryzae CBMB20]|uniref:Protein of unassigned function n=1 Tax=Methylobacterium oryzae CBMB20 TaxID=693986 RepID=A0A089NX29_9HYPH|nr:protein of unassigned function [Methylobacterium oryzae CBMB20]
MTLRRDSFGTSRRLGEVPGLDRPNRRRRTAPPRSARGGFASQ